jgi:hypothetical protein
MYASFGSRKRETVFYAGMEHRVLRDKPLLTPLMDRTRISGHYTIRMRDLLTNLTLCSSFSIRNLPLHFVNPLPIHPLSLTRAQRARCALKFSLPCCPRPRKRMPWGGHYVLEDAFFGVGGHFTRYLLRSPKSIGEDRPQLPDWGRMRDYWRLCHPPHLGRKDPPAMTPESESPRPQSAWMRVEVFRHGKESLSQRVANSPPPRYPESPCNPLCLKNASSTN